MNHVVVHFRDGRMLKGVTHDIHKSRSVFHLAPPDALTKTITINIKDVKAVFFVRSYADDVQKGMGHMTDGPQRPAYGRKAEIQFFDGEKVVGHVQAFNSEEPMIMLVPDKEGNNERIFIPRTSITSSRWLSEEKKS